MIATVWPFIEINAAGIALVEGTRVKVSEIAADHLAYWWDAQEIHSQHPHLSLPQIHAALGYYFENQATFDQQLAEDVLAVDRLRDEHASLPVQLKLRRLKRGG